jgi:hypothetical protein
LLIIECIKMRSCLVRFHRLNAAVSVLYDDTTTGKEFKAPISFLFVRMANQLAVTTGEIKLSTTG